MKIIKQFSKNKENKEENAKSLKGRTKKTYIYKALIKH